MLKKTLKPKGPFETCMSEIELIPKIKFNWGLDCTNLKEWGLKSKKES